MARGRIRKVLLGVGVAALVCGGVAGGVIYGGPYMAAQLLHQNGFPAAYVEGVSLSPSGIYIDHIALDGDGFSIIDQVSVSLSGLSIDRVTVKAIELSGEIDDNGRFKLAGWDATVPASSSSSLQGLLPISSLYVQGMTLDLDTPEGDIRIKGKMNLTSDDANHHQNVSLSLWGAQRQLSFTLNANGRLHQDGTYNGSAELYDGRINVIGAELSRVAGKVSVVKTKDQHPVYTGQILAGRVNVYDMLLQNINLVFDTSKPSPFSFKTSPSGYPDVTFAGRWNKATSPEQLELSIEAKDAGDLYRIMRPPEINDNAISYLKKISPVTIQLALPPSVLDEGDKKEAAFAVIAGEGQTRISGVFASNLSNGESNVTLLPVTLQARTIEDFLPQDITKTLSLSEGQATIKGQILIAPDEGQLEITGPLTIDTKTLGGQWDGTTFKNLSGPIEVFSVWPWAFGAQSLSVTLQDLAQGTMGVSGTEKEGIKISNAVFKIAGGRVSASPFTISPDGKASTTTLTLNNIQMGDLSQLIDDPSFKADGVLEGHVPVEIKNGRITLRSGEVSSTGHGSFQYSPKQFPASLQGDDPRMKTVREALKNFNFTELSLKLSGAVDGKMSTNLQAKGTSPVFGERPIVLNLNMEGDLGPVLKNALHMGDIGSTLRSIKRGEK